MNARLRFTRPIWPKGFLQNRSAVATALYHRAGVDNNIEAPRHSEATTTFVRRVLGALDLTILVSFVPRAHAVERGLGRPISGMSIAPYATVIPPEPGFGIDPIVTYSTKLGKSHLDFSARWIHDFDVSQRVEGNAFNLARA